MKPPTTHDCWLNMYRNEIYIIEFYRWFLHVFARCIMELNLIVFFRLHLLPIRNMSKTPTAKCCQPGRKPIESVSGRNDLDQWGRIKMGDP